MQDLGNQSEGQLGILDLNLAGNVQGRVFRNNAVISALGVPQIAAIMGNCVAGGGYLPEMSPSPAASRLATRAITTEPSPVTRPSTRAASSEAVKALPGIRFCAARYYNAVS